MADKLSITTIAGSVTECGRAYGERFGTHIVGFCRQEVAPDEPRLEYARRCWPLIEEHLPVSAAFMRGMSEAAALPLETLTLLSLHEEVFHLTHPNQPDPERHHCTGFAVTGAASRGGAALVGQNWDWAANLYPWPGLLRLHMDDQPAMALYHYPGLWAAAGVNEHGLALMWTGMGYFPAVLPVDGLPTYALIAEILTLSDLDQALALLGRRLHAGTFAFLIGDAHGQIAAIEAIPGHLAIERGPDMVHRGNHYLDPDMWKLAEQDHALMQKGNTGYRTGRICELLRKRRPIDARAGKAILLDRDGPGPWLHQWRLTNGPADLGGMTLDSLLADCRRRTLWACRGGQRPGPWQRIAARAGRSAEPVGRAMEHLG